LGTLAGDAVLNLGANVVRRVIRPIATDEDLARRHRHGPALGVEDDALGRAFDIDGPATLATAAVVGHYRKRVLLALPRCPEILQRLFHLQQVGGHALQRLVRVLRLGGGLIGSAAQRGQCLLSSLDLAALILNSVSQLRTGVLFIAQAGGDLAELFAHLPHLQLQFDLLPGQPGVQCIALLLPGGARLSLLLLEVSPPGFLTLRTLLGLPCRFALRPRLGRLVCLPVHDEQDQDQRPHGAEQHGQEGERRNLQLVPASSHAAFPG
jgi:hypothetical protein